MLAPYTSRLDCNSCKPSNDFGLGTLGDAEFLIDDLPCWNCEASPKNKRGWNTHLDVLDWTRSWCDNTDEEFIRTWSLPFRVRGDGSVITWAATTTALHYAAYCATLEVSISDGSGNKYRKRYESSIKEDQE